MPKTKPKTSIGIIIASAIIFLLLLGAFVFIITFNKKSTLTPQQREQLTEIIDDNGNPEISGQFDVDTDGDGWSDSKEDELGTDSEDATSYP